MREIKVRIAKIIVTVVLLAGAAVLLLRGKADPLAAEKRLAEIAAPDPEAARRTTEQALAAIDKGDMTMLFSLMARKDRMIFDSEYAEGLFAKRDFAPARIVGITGLRQQQRTFAAVDVRSQGRGRDYRFMLAPDDKNAWRIVSITPR